MKELSPITGIEVVDVLLLVAVGLLIIVMIIVDHLGKGGDC